MNQLTKDVVQLQYLKQIADNLKGLRVTSGISVLDTATINLGLITNTLSASIVAGSVGATQLGSLTSAELAGKITDETGSGALVFATSPTLVTPLLGTPTSGVLTNCTGLPAASIVAGALANGMTATTQASGDNDTSIATTAFVTDAVAKQPEVIAIACSDLSTEIVTDTDLGYIRMPFAMTLTSVKASLLTAASSGTFTVDIHESGTTILSTKLTIDATETTSTTAATPAVISDTSLASDALITIDVDDDAAGDAVGLIVYLIGTRT